MTSFSQARSLALSFTWLLAACGGDGATRADPREDDPLPEDRGPHDSGTEQGDRDAGQEPPRGDVADDGGPESNAADAGGEEDPDGDESGSDAGAAAADDAGVPEDEVDGGKVIVGTGGVVTSTIVVHAGETFDGDGKRYEAGLELGDGSQDENQEPVFRLEDGARLTNVVLGAPAADGIHTHGNVTLTNIVWEDIGEDALTIKKPGTVVLDGGSASNGDDKVFQINAPSTFRVSNFRASHAGKFIRQNGGTTFKVEVFIDRCDISSMDEAIFRTDSDTSTVSMTNTRYSDIGDALFIGVSPDNISTMGNTEY